MDVYKAIQKRWNVSLFLLPLESLGTRLTPILCQTFNLILPPLYNNSVTFHDETKHIALTTDFELRLPLPTAAFELLLQEI